MDKCVTLLDEIQKLQTSAERVMQPLAVLPVLHFDEGVKEYTALNDNVENFKQYASNMKEDLSEYKDLIQEMKVLQDELSAHNKDLLSFASHQMKHCQMQPMTHDASGVLKRIPLENQAAQQTTTTKKKTPVPCYRAFTEEEYADIPKHIRSHMSLQVFNDCLNEVNLIWKKKYEFLARPKKGLSLSDQKKRSKYLDEAKPVKDSPHSIFFTDDDINAFSTVLKVKKKTKQSVFLCLRHVGMLKETRVNKLTRYAFLKA